MFTKAISSLRLSMCVCMCMFSGCFYTATNLINKTDFNVSFGLLSASNSSPKAVVEDNLNRDNPHAIQEHLEEELQQAGAKTTITYFNVVSLLFAVETNSCKFTFRTHLSYFTFVFYSIFFYAFSYFKRRNKLH